MLLELMRAHQSALGPGPRRRAEPAAFRRWVGGDLLIGLARGLRHCNRGRGIQRVVRWLVVRAEFLRLVTGVASALAVAVMAGPPSSEAAVASSADGDWAGHRAVGRRGLQPADHQMAAHRQRAGGRARRGRVGRLVGYPVMPLSPAERLSKSTTTEAQTTIRSRKR